MIREAIGTGASVDEATKAAKQQLAAPEDVDIKIEIVAMPQKKTLGLFGGSEAKVKVSYEIEDKKDYSSPQQQSQPPKKENQTFNRDFKKEKPSQPVQKEVVVEISKPFVKADLLPTQEYKNAEEYLRTIILGIGMEECSIKALADDEEIVFEVSCGDDYGLVIGRRGETLDAIQYLTRMVANHGKSEYKRVCVNVGNYREKREASLRSVARKNAFRVIKTGRSTTLEPMNPYERRIIHTTVQEIRGATSYSTGFDLDRRVVIAPDGNSKVNTNSGNAFQRNDNKPFEPRKVQAEEPAENTRSPKSDFDGTSLYGKIEVNKD